MMGMYRRAEKQLKTAIELDSSYSMIYASYAKLYMFEGKYKKAIANYKKTIKTYPGFAIAYYNIACCYAKLGKPKASLDWLSKGKKYFNADLIKASKSDPDLANVRKDPYFSYIME